MISLASLTSTSARLGYVYVRKVILSQGYIAWRHDGKWALDAKFRF